MDPNAPFLHFFFSRSLSQILCIFSSFQSYSLTLSFYPTIFLNFSNTFIFRHPNMYSKSIAASLAILAVASPVFSAPVPVPVSSGHNDLEARIKLPAGAIKDLLKSLGGGILSGGAISGLLSLLGGGDDAAPAPAARELDARAGLGALLSKLLGAGEDTLSKVLKNAVIGGVASGVAVEGVNTAAGQRRAAVPASVVTTAEKGIGSVISNGLASGLGSALGGLGIGAILDKLFNKRSFEDLSDEEVNTLLEFINDNQSTGIEARGGVPPGIGKLIASLLGKLLGKAKRSFEDLSDEEVNTLLEFINDNQSTGIEARGGVPPGIGKLIASLLGKLLGKAKRSLEDLSDEEVNTLLEYINSVQPTKRALEDLSDDEVVALLEYVGSNAQTDKRALGSVGKGIAGLIASLAATQGAESAIEEIKGLFAREVSLNDLD
ncbi:hypothetical protein B0H17DRAFT_649504 [Mycena rosella]|uniref:Uncharacterized protein n=1 Tax=Mycena rosella TaxID=1033263 RepID=A0AAD7DD34_MYCRO|nr:hypothetical protein B0H17DRAFT_649504 [Mycena rosella]